MNEGLDACERDNHVWTLFYEGDPADNDRCDCGAKTWAQRCRHLTWARRRFGRECVDCGRREYGEPRL